MLPVAANLSLLFREEPCITARVAAAASAGFDGVEVQFPYEAPAPQWREALDAAGLPLVLFNVPAGDLMQGGDGLACVPGREAAFAAALAQCADYARLLRPRCVNVLAGRQPAGVTRAACLDVLAANLRLAVAVLAPLGVQVTLEAINTRDMPRFLVSDLATQQALCAATGAAVQYDIFHMVRMQEPVAGQLAAHGGSFAHVQFADAPGRHEPGSGQVDFAGLLPLLVAAGYRGWLAAEYLPAGATAGGLGWLPAVRRLLAAPNP